MDLKAIRNKMQSLSSNGSGKREKIDYSTIYWKPKKEGKYQIRILPSKHNASFPFKEFMVHYGFGQYPVASLTNWGEKDPIVEFAKKLRQSDDRENWSLAKKIEPKMRIYAPVIVRGEEEKGVRLWEFGKNIYLQLLGIADDEDYGDYTDVNEGRDFTVEAVTGDIGGRQGLKMTLRVKPKTTPLSNDAEEIETWLDNQPNILEVQRKMEFDQVKDLLQKWLSPEDEEEEDEEEEGFDETLAKATQANKEKTEQPAKKYQAPAKSNKSKSFDDLFEEEDDLPF